MTEQAKEKPTIGTVLTDMENDIQSDIKGLAKWKGWKKKIGMTAGVAFLVTAAAARIPYIGQAIALVAIPTFLASAVGYVCCRIGVKNREKALDEKYQRQANLITAIENARAAPGTDLKLAQLAEEFSHASRIGRLEQVVEELKGVLGQKEELDKAKPGKSGISL